MRLDVDLLRESMRPTKHVAVTVSARRLAMVRVAQQRLDDLTAFAGADLDERARFICIQGDKMIYEVPNVEGANGHGG